MTCYYYIKMDEIGNDGLIGNFTCLLSTPTVPLNRQAYEAVKPVRIRRG